MHPDTPGTAENLSQPAADVVLRMQLLFLAGMTITIGVQATMQFFSRRKNRKVIDVQDDRLYSRLFPNMTAHHSKCIIIIIA